MKKLIAKCTAVVLIVCVTLGLTGCTTYNNFKNTFFSEDMVATERTVKIGIYEPMSGEYKSQGKLEVMGIELAHDLYPTVCGKNVELVYGDNQSSMYTGDAVIQEILKQSPSVVLGSYGETLTLVASDYLMASNTPGITISSTNPLITVNNDYYFSATYTETRQGDALADFAYTQMNKDVVATVKNENDDTATATIKRFTNRIKRLTGNNKSIAASFSLPIDMTDYSEAIESIRNSGAKAVFLALPTSAAINFLQQAEALKITHVLFLGPKEWNNDEMIEFAKSSQKLNIAYPSDFSQESVTVMSSVFLEAYKTKYGQDAEPAESTAVAFDAYLLALSAIQKAQDDVMAQDPETIVSSAASEAEGRAAKIAWQTAYETGIPVGPQIRKALSSIENFDGASGLISYNGKNEATKTIIINHIDSGNVLPTFAVE